MSRGISVLGSTGSIGTQTLEVVRANSGRFKVAALAAHSSLELMLAQVEEFEPLLAVMVDEAAAAELERRARGRCRVAGGEQGLLEAAALDEAEAVMAAVVGFAGLRSILCAIEHGKHVALANKESLVAGGHVVMAALEGSGAALVPVDSEHNSIFQCLLARRSGDALKRVVLTASGGPFLRRDLASLAQVTPEEALKHPRWSMGAKNSLDSATMMNKALEIIEAAHLFRLGPEQIKVLIHPQSLVHGLVEFQDGTSIAAVSSTDMRLPIAHALSYLDSDEPLKRPGARGLSGAPELDLAASGPLEFIEPDPERFPALDLAYTALRGHPGLAIVLNAANEVAGAAFLGGEIQYPAITRIVQRCMQEYNSFSEIRGFDDILEVHAEARRRTAALVREFAL